RDLDHRHVRTDAEEAKRLEGMARCIPRPCFGATVSPLDDPGEKRTVRIARGARRDRGTRRAGPECAGDQAGGGEASSAVARYVLGMVHGRSLPCWRGASSIGKPIRA